MKPHPLVATAWLAPAVPGLAVAILIAAGGNATAIGIAAFGLGFALRNAISIQQAHSAHRRAETVPSAETRPNRKPQRPRSAAPTMNIFTAIGRTAAGIIHAPEPPDLERIRCATAFNDLPTAPGGHRRSNRTPANGCHQAGRTATTLPPRVTPPPPLRDETANADSVIPTTGYRVLGSILSELINAELLADDIAGRNRNTELRQLARQQQAVLNDQNLLDQAFEQHIATLSNGERPAGWANTHQAYREFQARLNQQLADTEAELAQPEPAPTRNDTAYQRVRDAVLRILDETAAAAGALPATDTAEAAEPEPPTATPESAGVAEAAAPTEPETMPATPAHAPPETAPATEPEPALATPVPTPPEPAVAIEPEPMPAPPEPAAPTASSDQPKADRTFTEPPAPLSESWISLTKFNRLAANISKPPAAIHFPDHPPAELSSWSEILTTTANHLIDTGDITTDLCPITVPPGKLPLISTEPVRDERNKLRTLPLHNGFHIANRHNRHRAARNAISMLRHFGVNPDHCHLMVMTADLPQPDETVASAAGASGTP